jgi:hypothetical protein
VEYIRTPLIRINWDGELSGYVESPEIVFFFQNTPHSQFEEEESFYKLLFYATYLFM